MDYPEIVLETTQWKIGTNHMTYGIAKIQVW